MVRQYEMDVPDNPLRRIDCDRVKFVNDYGTVVRCKGRVTLQRSIDETRLRGTCPNRRTRCVDSAAAGVILGLNSVSVGGELGGVS